MADNDLIKQALSRGYSIDEIADRLSEDAGMSSADIRSRGYSSKEIIGTLGYSIPEVKQSMLDRAKNAVDWNTGRDVKVPEGQTVTDDSFSAGIPDIQNEKPKRNLLMENSIMRNSNGMPATEQTADLSSLPSVQKISTPSLQFERQKESNRKWLDNSKPLVVGQLMRDNNLSAEDAEIEFSRMRNAGVVPKATESGLREATWGEAFDSGIAKVKPSFDKSMAGLASIKSDVTGDFALSSMADALRQEANKQLAEADGILAGTSKDSWKKTISDAPASLAQNLPTVIAASALASNPLLAGVIGNIGLAGMGMISGGAAYAEGKDSGLNVSNNLQQSGLKALAEVIPEKMSLNVLVGALGKKAAEQAMKDSILQSAKTLGKYFGAEIGTEELTTIAQFGVDKMYSKPDMTMKDLVGQMIDTAKATLIQAPILGGTGILTKAAVDTAGRVVDPTGYQLRGWADAVDRTNFTPMQGGAENFDGYDQRMAEVTANPFSRRMTRIAQAEQTKQAAQHDLSTAANVDEAVGAFNVANAAGSASIVDQSALLNELTGSNGLDASIAAADADAQALQAGIRDIDQQPTTLGERVSESGIPMGVANAPQISAAPTQAEPTDLATIKTLQADLAKAEPFSEQSSTITDKLHTAVHADAQSSLDAGEMPVYRVTDHVSVALHPSAQKEGMIQVTRYTKDGVIGDSQYNSVEEAIRNEGLIDRQRIDSAEAVKMIEQSIAAEADYRKRKSAEPIQPAIQTTQQQGSAAEGAIQQRPATQQSIIKPDRSGLASRDDLVGAIMRVTGNQGIAANMAQTITGDKAGSANPKLRGLFLNGGTMDLGDVAELLRVQENYDVRDGDHLSELIREVAGGDQVYSIDRMERDAAVNAEKQYKSEINRQAEELGLKKIGGKRTLAMVEADIARVEQERADMEARAERAAIQAESVYDELMGSDMSEADWLNWMSRSFKYTQEEIDYVSAIQANREDARTEADALYDSKEQAQGNLGERQEDGDAQAREGGTAEERLSTKRSEFRLEGQTNEQASEQKKESELTKEQIDRERDGTPFTLEQESQPKPMGTQGSLFARQITADEQATVTNVADADLPANVKQTAAFLRVMSRILGKKIQWVSGANFDGMVKDSDTIYLNVDGDTNKVAVFGHEFWHQVEMTHKAVFDAVLKVVDPMFDIKQATRMFNDYYSKNASEAEVSAWLKGKNEQGGNGVTNRDFLIREFLSDTTGNRFTESDFWGDVFAKLEQREGHLKAVTLIRRFVKSLTDALNKLTNALKMQGFRTDNDLTAEQIGQVKAALSEGMAQYLQDTRYGTKAQGAVASGAQNSTRRWNGVSSRGDYVVPSTPFYADNLDATDIATFDGLPVRITVGDHDLKYGVDHLYENGLANKSRDAQAIDGDKGEGHVRELLRVLKNANQKYPGAKQKITLRNGLALKAVVLEKRTDGDGNAFWSVITSVPASMNKVQGWGTPEKVKSPTILDPVAATSTEGYYTTLPDSLSQASVLGLPNSEWLDVSNPDGNRQEEPAPTEQKAAPTVTVKKRRNIEQYSPQRRFYSQLERTVEQTPDRIFATAPQFKLWLLANAGKFAIKKEEIQWTGITDWLDLQGKGKISKADVLGYLAQNGVQVEEVEKGEGMPLFSRQRTQSPPDETKARFDLPKFGKLDQWQERVQDRYNRIRDVVAAVRKSGLVNDTNDFSMGEDRFHGVAMNRMEQIGEDFESLITDMKAADVTLDEVTLYAYAEHAPERNAAMQRINKDVETGSGMSDQESSDIIDKAKTDGKDKALSNLSAKMRGIAERTLKLQLSSGLITQSEYDTLTNKYQKWVPLRGFETLDEDGKTFRGSGKGFNIRGKENLRALGRDSKAGQILENIILDAERAAIRGTKNTEVNHRFLRFVLDNPDATLWEIDRTKMQQAMKNGKVSLDSLIDKGDNTIGVKVNGEVAYVKIHDDKLFEQLANQWEDIETKAIPYLGEFQKYLSKSYTAWSPEFALYTNPVRDVQAALVSITGREGVGMMARFAKSFPKALAAAYRSEVLGKPDAWFDEYKAMGGRTGFWNTHTLQSKHDEIQALIKDMEGLKLRNAWRQPLKMAKALEKLISGHAGALENATRLASYMAMREAGRSKEQAAEFSKNLNVNFNRRGTWTPMLGSIFLFFNPAIQGTHNMYQTLTHGKHKKQAWALVGGGVMAMFALAMLNAGAGEDDDGVKWWDKIPDYEKERNIIIVIPSFMKNLGEPIANSTGRYIKFPMPYGWNTAFYSGVLAADVMRNADNPAEGTSAGKGALLLGKSFATSFSPVTGLPPQLAPFYQQAANKKPFGEGQLYPEHKWNEHKPGSEKYSGSMKGSPWQEWASFVNSATGGNKYQAGFVSIPPAVWRNYARSFLGGPMSFGTGVVDSISEGDVTKAPFARKIYGEVGNVQDMAMYYRIADEAIKVRSGWKDAKKAGDRPTAEAIYQSNKALIELGGMAEDTNDRLV